MHKEHWLVVDTETDGLSQPIHAVEIAAQRMCGWEPEGKPFQILLNHDVPIDPAAEAVHGYSREYLRKHGADPIEAHNLFHEYAQDLPVVAYNLSFDWDRVLLPEYSRLRLPNSGSKGFCALTLSRRTIPESPNYKLETLKQFFSISTGRSHRGRNDVETLVRLMTNIIKPRLINGGIEGFAAIQKFSRQTPVASCLEMLRNAVPQTPVWYVLQEDLSHAGPFTVAHIKAALGERPFFAWREGMAQWVASDELPEFATSAPKKRKARPKKEVPLPAARKQRDPVAQAIKQEIAELAGICKGIMSDGVITAEEFILLRNWLISCPHPNVYPMSVIADMVERIAEDGIFTTQEHDELMAFLEEKLSEFEGTSRPKREAQQTASIPRGNHYDLISLTQGSDEWLAWRNEGIGASDAPAIMGENPWKSAAQILQDKISKASSGESNDAMRRGTALEPIARKDYVAKRGIEVVPVCIQHQDYPWLRASLDGLSVDCKTVLEIKCGARTFESAVDGIVPKHYYGQLQHILMATGLPAIDFWVFSDYDGGILLTVKRDDDYIARLFDAEQRFWNKVISQKT